MTNSPLSIWREGAAPPCPELFNAAQHCVSAPAQANGQRDALIIVDGDAPKTQRARWSFAQIDDRVRRAAGALLQAGVERGDRVLIQLDDGPEFPIAYFGAMAAGAVAMPLSAQLAPAEIARIAAEAEPRVALIPSAAPALDLGEAVRLDAEALAAGDASDFAETASEDPALLIYTSGSSGTPKGVLHAHRAIWARRMMHAGWHDIQASDRVMHAGAFNWTYTLGVGLSDPWSVGAAAIVNTGSRAPEVWPRLAAAHQPTVFAAVPGVYRRILKYGENIAPSFTSLRHGVTAGEALNPAISEQWRRATGKPLFEALGMSELSTYVSGSPTRRPAPGWCGWAQPGRHVAVLNEAGEPVPRGVEGELAAHRSDPGLMLGYWRRREETDQAFRGDWFVSGDRAVMGDDGALRYVGRSDDQMNAQGYRVGPLEVEAAFLSHPDVSECGAAELAVADGLSVIALWVVLQNGAALDKAALLAHGAQNLASYKLPKEIFTLNALPRSANGKLLRRALTPERATRLT